MSLEILTLEDFAPHVGTAFTLAGTDETPAIDFLLTEATALSNRAHPGQAREPFQLMFRAASPHVYPQGLYRLAHSAMGEKDIFLVAAAQSEGGVDYCATFN